MFTENSSVELVTPCGRSGRSPFSNRHLSATGVIVTLLASVGTTPGFAQTVPSVAAPAISAGTLLVAGQPSRLTATSRIATNPANPVIVTNLLRVDSRDKTLYSVGHMTDDGKGGDAVAGDGIYTLQFQATEPAPGPMRFRTFAAFKSTVPVVSSTTIVTALAASAPVREAIGDVFLQYPVTSAEISVDEFGRKVARRQLEIVFRAAATAAEVNQALAGIGATITGSVTGTRAVVVRIPDPGSLSALNTLVAQIEANPLVWFVERGIMAAPDALPQNISPSNNNDPPKVANHLAVKGHAAWNAMSAITESPRVVVIDYFGAGPPPNPLPPDQPYLSYDPVDVNDFTSGQPNDHGYHVLGIISGSFGGDLTGRGLVTGMFPQVVELRVGDNQGQTAIDDDQFIIYRTLSTRRQVVNTSLGGPCTQNGPCQDVEQTRRRAVKWIEKVRARGLEDRVLHVTSAGNIEDPFRAARDAMTNSQWTAAALMTDLRDELGNLVPPLTNTVVVENAMTTVGGSTPYGVECLRWSSFTGGTLSAIGTDVWSFTATGAFFNTGTSMAAPQVAGLAAYLWSIDPSLSPQAVKKILTDTANPLLPRNQTDCSDWATPAPSIDAYAALLALDNPAALQPFGDRNLAKVRRAVLDVVGTGGASGSNDKFDSDDLAVLYYEIALRPERLDYSRYDLNGDGYTGGSRGSRLNLDIEGLSDDWTTAIANIGGAKVAFNERQVTDLDVLCYYAYSNLYAGPQAPDTVLTGCRQVKIQVSPASATVQPLETVSIAASVTNAGDPSASVRWTFSDGSRSITSNNCDAGCSITYTAPSTSGTYVVTATSVADPTKIATATITVTGTNVTVIPGLATLFTGESRTFTAALPVNSNLTVSWSASCGSVSPTTGLTTTYTAPLDPPPAPGWCVLTATVPGAPVPGEALITVLAAVSSRVSNVFSQIAGQPPSTSPPLSSTATQGRFNPDPALSTFTRSCSAAASAVQDSDVTVQGGVLTRLTGILNARSATGIAAAAIPGLACLAAETARSTFEVVFNTKNTMTFNLTGTATLNRTSDVSLSSFGDNWLSVTLEKEPSLGFALINVVPLQTALSSTMPLNRSVVLPPGTYRFRVEARTATSRVGASPTSSEISMAIDLAVDLVP